MQILIQTLSLRAVSLTKQAAERIQACERDCLCRFCLQPILEGDKVTRKCHDKCDKVLRRGVDRGDWTDEEQQQAGMWGPPDRSGRPRREPACLSELKPRAAS